MLNFVFTVVDHEVVATTDVITVHDQGVQGGDALQDSEFWLNDELSHTSVLFK